MVGKAEMFSPPHCILSSIRELFSPPPPIPTPFPSAQDRCAEALEDGQNPRPPESGQGTALGCHSLTAGFVLGNSACGSPVGFPVLLGLCNSALGCRLSPYPEFPWSRSRTSLVLPAPLEIPLRQLPLVTPGGHGRLWALHCSPSSLCWTGSSATALGLRFSRSRPGAARLAPTPRTPGDPAELCGSSLDAPLVCFETTFLPSPLSSKWARDEE